MSKGSHRRPTKEDITAQQFGDNWDKIYNDKDKEKESTDEETRNESRDGE